MGLFGFLGDVTSAAVKVALTPVAIVKDAAAIVLTDDDAGATKDLLKSAGQDLEDSVDELIP